MVEVSTLSFLLVYLLNNTFIKFNNQFIIVLVFLILFIFLVIGKGVISRISNNNFFVFLGKYTYSIYMMQSFSFWILSKTFWLHTNFLERHICISIAVSLGVCIILGGVTYHLVERPIVKLYKKARKNFEVEY